MVKDIVKQQGKFVSLNPVRQKTLMITAGNPLSVIEKASKDIHDALDPVIDMAKKIDLTSLGNRETSNILKNFSDEVKNAATKVRPFKSYDEMLNIWLGATQFQRVSTESNVASHFSVSLMYKAVDEVISSDYKVCNKTGINPNYDIVSPEYFSFKIDYNKEESLPTNMLYLLEDKKGSHLIVDFSRNTLTVHSHKDQEELIGQFYDKVKNWIKNNNFFKNKVLQLKGSLEFMEDLKEKKTTWNDIALSKQSEALIKSNTVDFIKNLDIYKENGKHACRNILLSGPPGTGKSMVSDILINELKDKVSFIYVTAKSVPNAEKVSTVFKAARNLSPSIVIMEDLDLIGSVDRYSSSRQDILNELLNQLSGVYDNTGVVVVGTTNQPNVFDEALLRPLRFSTIVPMLLPDKELRESILKKNTRDLQLAPDVNLTQLAEVTEGFSGAGLTELKELAIQNAIETGSMDKDEKVHLEDRHFKQALETIEIKKRYQEESMEDSITT